MAPRFRINAHVFYYSLTIGIATAAALGLSKAFGKTDEQKRRELVDKYPDTIRMSQNQKNEMQAFFDKMKESRDQDQQDKFQDLLKGGKNEVKRQQIYKTTPTAPDPAPKNVDSVAASAAAVATAVAKK